MLGFLLFVVGFVLISFVSSFILENELKVWFFVVEFVGAVLLVVGVENSQIPLNLHLPFSIISALVSYFVVGFIIYQVRNKIKAKKV